MSKLQRAQKSRIALDKKPDTVQMENIYKVRAEFADIFYITGIMRNKSTMIRLTACEKVQVEGVENYKPVHATIMSIEDFQALYSLMTNMLENYRKIGRIE